MSTKQLLTCAAPQSVDGLDKQSGFSIAPVAQYCSVALERVNKEIETVGTPDDFGSVEVVKGRRINERIFEKMDMLTVWASEIEIFADAQILQTSVFVGNGRQPHAHISHQVKPLHEGTLLLHLLPHGHTAPERGAGAAIGQRDQCPGPRGLRRVQQPEGGVGRYGAKNGAEIELAGSVYEEKLFDLKTKNIVLDVSAINQAPEIQRRVPPDP
eukprot:Em0012g188a